MKVAVYSTKEHDREIFEATNLDKRHVLEYHEAPLGPNTADMAKGTQAVCIFVNDRADAVVLKKLASYGVKLIALRCAGYDNVDLAKAEELGMTVVRVPAYMPEAVAEHAVALLLAVNRKIHRAYNRTRDGDFSLTGMMGMTLRDKRIAVIGTGAIGTAFARIMKGFGSEVVGYSPHKHAEFDALGCEYGDMNDLAHEADVISLHCPLTPETHHMINSRIIKHLKPGALIINTARGGLIDTKALIAGLRSGRLGGAGIDVYEHEAHLFFRSHANQVLHDEAIERLMALPNVIVTGHQAFLTQEAVTAICEITLSNFDAFEAGVDSPNALHAHSH